MRIKTLLLAVALFLLTFAVNIAARRIVNRSRGTA